MKTYFGGSCGLRNPFYLELLGMLEESIPSLEQILVETSAAEMSSQHDEWRIFYYKRTILGMCSIIAKMTGTQKCTGSTIGFQYDETEALSYGTA